LERRSPFSLPLLFFPTPYSVFVSQVAWGSKVLPFDVLFVSFMVILVFLDPRRHSTIKLVFSPQLPPPPSLRFVLFETNHALSEVFLAFQSLEKVLRAILTHLPLAELNLPGAPVGRQRASHSLSTLFFFSTNSI